MPAEVDYGAEFGAARLGPIAASGGDPASVRTPPAIAATIEPESALRDAFDRAYQRYREIYPAIATLPH